MRARLPTLASATVCALVAVSLLVNGRDASLVREANEAGAAGNFDEVVRLAEQVERSPAEARALVAIARAHTEAGRARQADRAWAAAARRDPNNWQVHLEWAGALYRLRGGESAAVRRRYARARELNPKLPALP